MNNFFVNPTIKKYVVNPSEPEIEDEDDEDYDPNSFYRKEIKSQEAEEVDNDEDIKLLPEDDDIDK
jgi:hypothetical protein